jgi:hypothetical protein
MLLVLAVMALPALAQEAFHVGQTVETADGRKCQIESITGASAKVRCGPNRWDIRVYNFESLISARAAAMKREQQQPRPLEQQQVRAGAQSLNLSQGDMVQVPDGRTGKIEVLKADVAKVKFGASAEDFQYFVIQDLKRMQAPKPAKTEPLETFHAGDTVEDARGKQLTIDSISGDTAIVRYGVGKYNVYQAKLEDLVGPRAAAAKREQVNQRKIFAVEAEKYSPTIRLFEQFYSPETAQVKGGIDADAIKKATTDFEALDTLCKARYQGVSNMPGATYEAGIQYRYADWCAMAAKRNELLHAATTGAQSAAGHGIVEAWKRTIDKSLNHREDWVGDEAQMMVFESEKWKGIDLPKLQRLYAQNGGTVPADIFDVVKADLQKLREKIETDVKTKSWKVPPYKDAAVESFVKSQFASHPNFKGTVVVKSGLDYTTWKLYKNAFGIPTSQVKLGWVLVKRPNQQGLCQMRDFSVKKDYQGGGTFSAIQMASRGAMGIYVKCN